MTSPHVTHLTNWLVGSIEVHIGDTVVLDDGRQGVIVRVSRGQDGRLDGRGWPEIEVDGELVAVSPASLAVRVERS